MAFKNSRDSAHTEPNEKVEEKELIFKTYEEQIVHTLKYLKSEYGLDFNDPDRKPGMHINKPNNPFYVGNVDYMKNKENETKLPTKSTEALLNFFKK